MLLALKMEEGAMSQRMQKASRSWRRQGNRFSLELPKELPRRCSGEESACNARFDPWGRKIPWRREWQPTPVFLPEEFHGQMSLVGNSLWGYKESDITE